MRLSSSVMLKFLLALMLSTGLSACFDSNSESSVPSLVRVNDSGGTGSTPGVDDSLSVPVDSTGSSIDVLRNDVSGVELVGFEQNSTQGGMVTRDGNTGTLTYQPPAGFNGEDSFTYSIRDSQGNVSTVTVSVSVDNAIVDSGRDFYNRECGICHKAGNEDQQNAFNATDLVASSTNFDYDMSQSDTRWSPPLMAYYTSLSQKQLDGLRAYIGSLRNP